MSTGTTQMSRRRILLVGLASGLLWGGAMAAFFTGPLVSWVFGRPALFSGASSSQVPDLVVRGLICLAGGIVFGACMAGVMFLGRRQQETSPIDLEPGESVLLDGPANHWKGRVSVGGWLYLTGRRLRFRSHRMNLWWNHDESFPLARFVEIESVVTLGFVPNGFQVHLENGGPESFVVVGAAAWLEAIERARVIS